MDAVVDADVAAAVTIAPLSSVVRNVLYDRQFCDLRIASNPEAQAQHFDVGVRELALSLRPEFDAHMGRPPESQHGGRVFTSANDAPAFALPGVTRREQLRNQFYFVGVPTQQALHGRRAPVRGDIVSVQVSGGTTVFNTGPVAIEYGDHVLWDVPDADAPGKQVFWTVPLRTAATEDLSLTGPSIAPRSKELYAEYERLLLAESPEAGEAQRALMRAWTEGYMRFASRIIGHALTGAKPGEAFDIVLNRAH